MKKAQIDYVITELRNKGNLINLCDETIEDLVYALEVVQAVQNLRLPPGLALIEARTAEAAEKDALATKVLIKPSDATEQEVFQVASFGIEAHARCGQLLLMARARDKELTEREQAIAPRVSAANTAMQEAERIKATWEKLRRELVEMTRERNEAIAESARRYDCHGGPGTTEPACGACVSCLMRAIEPLEKDVKFMSGERDKAQAESAVLRAWRNQASETVELVRLCQKTGFSDRDLEHLKRVKLPPRD